MSSTQNCRPVDRESFEVAIICALSTESDAVEALFDEFWEEEDEQYGKAPGDPNSYTLGRIGRLNVVLAYLPAIGKASSAIVAASFRASFPCVRLGLVVGVCGGVPRPVHSENIFLGDIIVSTGVIQFDFGRQFSDRVVRKDTLKDNLGRPNHEIRAFLTMLQGWQAGAKLRRHVFEYVHELSSKRGFEAWACPKPQNDELYQPSYRHKHHHATVCVTCDQCTSAEDAVCDAALESACAQLGCDRRYLEHRDRPFQPGPTIHFGLIASGDLVIKSGIYRDRLAVEERVIGFEMEGAGVWDSFPTIVVKGVCDYADSHKTKRWQKYAAMTAAACAKALLRQWRGIDKPRPSIPEVNSSTQIRTPIMDFQFSTVRK